MFVGVETWDEDPSHVYVLFQEIDYPSEIKQGIENSDLFERFQLHARQYEIGQVVTYRGESWRIKDMGEIGPHYTYNLVGIQCGEEVRDVVLEWMLHRENRDE